MYPNSQWQPAGPPSKPNRRVLKGLGIGGGCLVAAFLGLGAVGAILQATGVVRPAATHSVAATDVTQKPTKRANPAKPTNPAKPPARKPTIASTMPTNAAKVGVPFRVVQRSGAVADVTLTKITYTTKTPDGSGTVMGGPGGEYAVLDVRITGRSARPFHYSEQDFAFEYADGPDPYNTAGGHVPLYGVDPQAWDAFPPKLNVGAVTKGHEVRGTVPLELAPKTPVLFFMTDENSATQLAMWLTTSG